MGEYVIAFSDVSTHLSTYEVKLEIKNEMNFT